MEVVKSVFSGVDGLFCVFVEMIWLVLLLVLF